MLRTSVLHCCSESHRSRQALSYSLPQPVILSSHSFLARPSSLSLRLTGHQATACRHPCLSHFLVEEGDYSSRWRLAPEAVLTLVLAWARRAVSSHEPPWPRLEGGGQRPVVLLWASGMCLGFTQRDRCPCLLEVGLHRGLPPPQSTFCFATPDLVLPAQHFAKFRLC